MEGQNLGTRKMHRVKNVTIFWLYVYEISDRKIQVKGGGCQLKNKKTLRLPTIHILFLISYYTAVYEVRSQLKTDLLMEVASVAVVSVINGEQRATY